jgi:hypothetical protein
MARLRPPQLPAGHGNEDLVRALTLTLREVITQLNGLSDGQLSASTSAQAAAPTTGAHAQGDFIRNAKPAAGGVYGWVCVAGGTPGVWKAVSIGA